MITIVIRNFFNFKIKLGKDNMINKSDGLQEINSWELIYFQIDYRFRVKITYEMIF